MIHTVTLLVLMLPDYQDLTTKYKKHIHSTTPVTNEHTSIRSEAQLK